jgi:hypothetical protein
MFPTTPWAVLLCKFNDDDSEPHPRDYYEALFAAPDGDVFSAEGYMPQYFSWMSHGLVSLKGSRVFGWYRLNKARSEYTGSGSNPTGRNELIDWARQAAAADGVDFSKFWNVVVGMNVPTDLFGGIGGVVCDSKTTQPHWLGQVMGYAYGHEPSRADGSLANYQDPWDIMSVGNAHSASDARLGSIGPGFNAANMAARGWIYVNRTWKTSDSSFDTVVTLKPLHRYHEAGFNAAEFGGYLAEFRDPDAGDWDAGLPRPAVLVHRFEDNHSYLMRATDGAQDLVTGSVFQTSDGTNPFVTQTRLEVLEISRDENNLGFARLRLTHRPAFEAPSLGPGILFGGVAHGGAGLIFIGGKIIRIPPRSPLFQMLEQLAVYEGSESIASIQTRHSVRREALSAITALAQQQMPAMPVFGEPARCQETE